MLNALAYERAAIRERKLGIVYYLWRRQGHKTTTMAKKSLMHMMKHPGSLVTFASASLAVGSELIVREGQIVESARQKVFKDAAVIRAAFDDARTTAEKGGMKLVSNGDGLKMEDFAELFEQQKLEARIWHSKTVFSRTIIIAPNPATARGWSGCVVIDEGGHVKPLRELLEAMEPILSSDPTFRLWLAGTMANDDAHYSNELTLEPDGMTFQPDPAGHWYESQAGIPVHRVDALDAAAAGLKTFDIKTRAEITPEEARKKAIDREAWDLNYGLKRKTGGTAAIALNLMTNAMAAGRDCCLFGEDDFVPDWRRHLGKGKFSVGFDIATTENDASNPSSVAVLEMVGQFVYVRLLLAFKTNDPEVSRSMIREAIDLGEDRRPRRLCIDATNERFFATDLKKEFAGKVPTELVISSEATELKGVKMLMKSYLGNILVNQFEDNLIAVPEARYVREDFRLVMRDKGGFDNQTDSRGRHGDTFDAVKLALHGLLSRGGPAEASAVGVGAGLGASTSTAKWKNPFAKLFDNGGTKTNA